ncbi:MAG TPA: ABC transporter substrate-binding protein [Solirubrobacterales bacterium]|jgi:polar amino acid transport system substrate-binding protein
MKSRLTVLIAAVAFAALTVAAGCGGDDNDNGGGGGGGTLTATPDINVSADQAVASQVPAAIKSKGTLTVAADATYPPDEFIATDGKTVIGMDADLANALASVMGLKASIQNVTFDAIIPGLAAGKYDLGMSSFTDTKEREQTVDFVTYLQAGSSIYVKADGGPDLTSLDTLCGHKVAAERGTTQSDQIDEQNTKCTAEGKPGVTPVILPDQNGVNLAVTSGRADAAMADSPVASYIAEKSNGQLKVTGGPFPPEPYGIAIPKDSGMAQPVLAGIKALMADGTYTKILEYWNLQAGAIDNPVINGAVS